MLLCAVILAGGNRESVIGGAIGSVSSVVDHFAIIDTGESANAAVAVAREMLGDRCTVFEFKEEFDCATARNFGLDCAGSLGSEWALMLDTDERIVGKIEDIPRFLREIKQNVALLNDAAWSYNKTKFVRLPRKGSWQGFPHEAFVTDEAGALPMWLSFRELPRTPEEEQVRAQWIELQCRKGLERDPGNARLHFYRADSLSVLGQLDGAVVEFLEASRLSKWADEIDWCHYRTARIRYAQGRHADALNVCFASSMRTPELLWFSAVCSATLDNATNALVLAARAAETAEKQRTFERMGFCERYAWFEGPHEVMSWVFKATGDTEREQEAIDNMARLKAERLRLVAA